MTKRNRLILLALPTLIAGIILIAILNWHIPTRVRISVTTDKVFLKTGGDGNTTILDSVGLKSIVLEKFATVKLKPQSISLLRHETPGGSQQTVANTTSNLTIAQLPIVITPRNGRSQSNVTLSADASDPRALLVIDAINAKPSTEVTLETTEDPGDLILRVDGQRSSGSIATAGPFRLAVDQSEISGISSPLDLTKPLTFKGKLLRDSLLQFESQEASLILTVTLPVGNSGAISPQGHLMITAITFEQLDGQSGKMLSALTKDSACEISYPDYEDKMGKATITKPDFLWLDDLQAFSIEEITYNPNKKGISLKLLGVANKITSGSPEYSKDHRLTVYDAIWNNYKVIAIFAVLCFVAGTTVNLFKFFKEN